MKRTKAEKRCYCAGCRDDFYNGHNNLGVHECWSLAKARIVTRYRIGWWTDPASPEAFTRVTTLSCHHAPGRYGLYDRPPSFARDVAESRGRR